MVYCITCAFLLRDEGRCVLRLSNPRGECPRHEKGVNVARLVKIMENEDNVRPK